MRMKVQFKALRAFTFFLGVVFGSNNAFTSAQFQNFQDQGFSSFGNLPYRIRCNVGYHSTLDNTVPYPTRCTVEPYDGSPGSSYFVNPPESIFGAHNPDAANTPYNAELSQSPTLPQISSFSFFTRETIPPYLIEQPAGDQKVPSTFSYRRADTNQEGSRLLLSEFPPFQRTKQSRESEYSSPANRNQHFLNKNLPFEAAVKSDLSSQRPKLIKSVLMKKDPIRSSGDSLYKQQANSRQHIPRENELTKSQFYSSVGNTPLPSVTSPSSEIPESSLTKDLIDGFPSWPAFFEEQEDPFFFQDLSWPSFSEEQEDPFFRQNPLLPSFSDEDLSLPYFSEEQEGPSSSNFSEEQVVPSFPQDPSSPSFFGEQDPSSPSLSEEPRVSPFPRQLSLSYFSEEQAVPSYPQYNLSPSFSEEQEVPSYPQYTSSPFFPQEQGASSFSQSSRYRHYPQHSGLPAVTFLVSDNTPSTKHLPSSQENDALGEVLELLQRQKINERPSWSNEEPNDRKFGLENRHKDDEDVWSPPVRRRRNSFLSKIQRKLKRIFHFPRRVQTRND